MPRPTLKHPQRGDARIRLLDAARDEIRRRGFTATTVDELCRAAGVTKGAFFHHFDSKEALGVAAAEHWARTTSELFAVAPYHEPADPLARVLAYIDFRRELIEGDPAEFTCLVGTMTQEVFDTHPAIRDACAASIFGHAATLEPDIAAAMKARRMKRDWTAASLAAHTQAVLQGAFILAKATGERAVALDTIDHLERYVRLLFSEAPSNR
ncbi:MAG: TetR/AcrR family transcriptional regulator [Burkholderiaceae bacterium]